MLLVGPISAVMFSGSVRKGIDNLSSSMLPNKPHYIRVGLPTLVVLYLMKDRLTSGRIHNLYTYFVQRVHLNLFRFSAGNAKSMKITASIGVFSFRSTT